MADEFVDDPAVFEEDGEFYIWSSRFTDLDDPDDVRTKARKITQMIRTYGALESLSVRDLKATNIHKIYDDETEQIYVKFGPAPIRIGGSGSTVTRVMEDGTEIVIDSPAKRTERRIQLALQDENVEELSSLLNQERNWMNMYKIYEFCEDNLPEGETPMTKRWISKTKSKLFKRTANSRGAIGDAARHGCEGQPPNNPMKQTEAKRLIDNVIKKWLDYRKKNIETQA